MNANERFERIRVQVQEALESLRAIERSAIDDCFIIADTGFDEATVIGSVDALLRLSELILEGVLSYCGNNSTSFGWQRDLEGLFTNDIKEMFGESGDVWPVCLFVTANSQGTRRFIAQTRGQ